MTRTDCSEDVSLTRVPESAKLTPTAIFVNIAALASLGWREARDQALGGIKPISSPLHKHNRQPDEQMLCFDNLYYGKSSQSYDLTTALIVLLIVGAAVQYEFEKTWAPAWNLIGQYMEYSPGIQKLARSLISKTFDLTDSDPFPKVSFSYSHRIPGSRHFYNSTSAYTLDIQTSILFAKARDGIHVFLHCAYIKNMLRIFKIFFV